MKNTAMPLPCIILNNLRQIDYNRTSNVSPVRASSVTDKLFYKTEVKNNGL